ncbi:hypothetical protein Lser_V15G11739 [Lactuca serriola]
MEQTPTPPLPSLSATTTAPSATYPESLDSSPRSRNTDSWGEDNSVHPSNNGSMTVAPQAGLTKLRLMCSYGGHIVPRPHDKSLCYIGGDTRIVVVDRHTTLSDLTQRLSKTLLRSSSSSSLVSTTASFTLKYQLPSEDLDSLISVTTDEDLENMIDEYERLNQSSDVSKSSRLRLFLFPTKPESASSIGSLLENSTKSEDWFLNALNGTTSGFSDTSSVNCLLGLEDDVPVPEKKDADQKGIIGKNPKGNTSAQDVHSVPDLERTSSFGSASSSPSLASLPPIRVHVDDSLKVGGIEEQFSQMSVQQQLHKHTDDGVYVAAPTSTVVTGVPLSSTAAMPVDYPNRVLSEDERSDQGSQIAYQKQQQQQYQQQKQSMGFDLASSDSVSSDGRQKPPMMYQDPLVQIQTSNNNRSDPNNLSDQNTRIQMQQQQIPESAYIMSMSNNQVDPQHPQLHHQQQQQQPQFIHTAVPPPQYIHHHPSGAVPMASYYQMYPSQNQHHPQHPALDQQNFVYYMPATRQPPHGYNLQLQQQPTSYAEALPATAAPQAPSPAYATARAPQTAAKSELPAGVYGTTNSGNSQFVQVPSSQHQPQYVGYSQLHHPPPQSVASSASGGGGNYGYEYGDPAQGQHIYYAAQPMPPQSTAQYQTMTGGESGSYLPTENSTKQQQGRTQ